MLRLVDEVLGILSKYTGRVAVLDALGLQKRSDSAMQVGKPVLP